MKSDKKISNIFSLILICVVLLVIAGTTGFLSRNWIPYEIKISEPLKFVQTSKTTSTTTTQKPFDVVEHTIGTAMGLIKEAPQFVFSFGSKLFSILDENNSDADKPESNVFSVVGKK
jgi:hypothetical protein